MSDVGREGRWRGRPILSAFLRFLVFVVPITASVLSSILIARSIPASKGFDHLLARWFLAFVVSTAVLFATDRLMRRRLPLAVLFRLSLAFPDEAPSRLKLARRAGSVRDLQEVAERARREGVSSEPARAAEQILELIAAVEAHDKGTRGHSERVRLYTDLLADQLKLHPHDRDRLRWAAMLHDVGKLMVPRAVLTKPRSLEPKEWEAIHRHPEEGARLIRPLREWLGQWAPVVEQHHERYDGKGYPRGLAGEAITFGGRIVAVADSYETMTARRPYRRPLRPAQAREELVKHSREQFDPHIVRAFMQISLRRLSLMSGPMSWLAQAPFLRSFEQAATAAGALAAGGALVVAGVTSSPTKPTSRPATQVTAASAPIELARKEVLVAHHVPLTASRPTPKPEPEPEPSDEPTKEPRPPRPPDEDDDRLIEASPSPSPKEIEPGGDEDGLPLPIPLPSIINPDEEF